MIVDSAVTRAITSKTFWIARVFTLTAALGLQLAGLYAVAVTFGGWTTFGLYAVGGLAVLLRHLAVWRATSCSPGE